MKNYESLSHTRYDCKISCCLLSPNTDAKKIYGAIRRHLGEIFHELAKQKESRILEDQRLERLNLVWSAKKAQ